MSEISRFPRFSAAGAGASLPDSSLAERMPGAGRVNVAIADDSPVMREGLARIIGGECDLAVSGSAASGRELRTLVRQRPPQVLVMELMLQEHDGLALIKDLLGLAPALPIVIFTQQPGEVYATRCLRAGARAFVSKFEPVSTLLRAIRETAAGGIVVPPGMAPAVFVGADHPEENPSGLAAVLTNRELQVFRLTGLALPTRVIAEKLGVSVKTVESHRENIKNKLNLDSHSELVAHAAQWRREISA